MDPRKGKAWRHWFCRTILSLPKIIHLLTSSSEDLRLVHTGPLWLVICFQDQASRPSVYEIHQPIDFWGNHQLALFVGNSLSLLQFSSVTKGWWFEPDRGLPAQAIREIETFQATLIAVPNLHQPCRHHLPNMCNLWQPQWQSWLARTKS